MENGSRGAGVCLPRVGGCPPALLSGADRQEEPGERGRSGSGALGMEQATAKLGLHLGLVPCPQHQWTQKNLGQNVSRVEASTAWSGKQEQTGCLDGFGVWGFFGEGSAVWEPWGYFCFKDKISPGSRGL